jgi:hypothetical protein
VDGEEQLRKIMCYLAPGMSVTVPDAWLDRKIPGPPAKRAARVNVIALDYGCALKHGIGVQTFEKNEIPYTG